MTYVQLGDICNVVKGEIGITKAIPGDFPMVTTAELRKSHNKFQLDTEAVLVPLVSATGHGHASIKRVHYQEGKFAFGSILAACVPKDENYSAKFLYVYFNLMKDYVLVPLMKGSANVSLTLGNLKKAKVPNISLQTQLEIVELYSKIKIEQDKVTDVLAKQEADINSLREAILQEAVQGKLTADWRANDPDTEDASILLKRIQEDKAQLTKDKKIKKEKALPPITKDETPYELPVGWVWCRLGEICSNFDYGTSTKSIESGKYPVIRMGNIQDGVIDWTKLKYTNDEDDFEQYKLQYGDLLFNRTNSREMVGKTAIYNERRDAIHAGYLVRVRVIKPIIPSFSNFVLNSPMHRDWCNTYRSDAIGQSNINATKLKSFVYPLCSHQEQIVIVQKVNALMGICEALEKEVQQNQEHCEQLMQSCLREVFEGNKEVMV